MKFIKLHNNGHEYIVLQKAKVYNVSKKSNLMFQGLTLKDSCINLL